MPRTAAAIVAFVKTPGLSPIKTRLAVGMGVAAAEEFYGLSVAAVEATLREVASATGAKAYWAVAEDLGMNHSRWEKFSRLYQGSGDLGSRLDNIFSQLTMEYSVVIGVGADAPQLSPACLVSALATLSDPQSRKSFVVGKCYDGGFYLIGTNRELPRTVWESTPYSVNSTAERLLAELTPRGEVQLLDTLTDVDEIGNLSDLHRELVALKSPHLAQQRLLEWLRRPEHACLYL